MKVKFGAIVVDGSGKLGGHVFSKNRSGNYMRTKVTPTNPSTIAQTGARALFGAISAGWSALTLPFILGWNEAVVEWQKTNIFGDLKSPSGKALYQRLNNQAQSAGWPEVIQVPAKEDFPVAIITNARIAVGAETIALSGLVSDAKVRVMEFATPVLSRGTKFVKNRLRLIETQLTSTSSEGDSYISYVAKYGAPSVGDNIYFGLKYVLANGQASPLQIIKAQIVA